MSSINLCTGELVDPFEIENYDLSARHFIHPLALLNRYTGHTKRPYSVAEHTVRLSNCQQVVERGLSRAAILHDFNEALTNDLPYPFKSKLPDFVTFEEHVQRYIFKQFDEPWENMEALKEFDRRICQDEMEQMFIIPFNLGLEPLGVQCEGWSWQTAEIMLTDACQRWGVL